MRKLLILCLALGMVTMFLGCEKFLDEKPNKKLTIPSTIQDLQALLDQHQNVNALDAASGEVSADDYYVTDADFARQTETDRRMYTWQRSYIYAPQLNDWYNVYTPLYRFNTVLVEADKAKLNGGNEAARNELKGQAYFLRARVLFTALTLWANAYQPNTAGTDLGIPLRLDVNFNEKSERSTVEQSYLQVVSDLVKAVHLLSDKSLHSLRANKAAAYALRARVHLAMQDFTKAALDADSCLQIKSTLIDFSGLNANANYPIGQFNAEVLFAATMNTPNILVSTYAKVSPQLYASYESDDLRKAIFFRKNTDNSYAFKGSYDGTATRFTGLSTNEVYLIRAEANARNNRLEDATKDLNTLLVKRYKSGTYQSVSLDQKALLSKILFERKKELAFRGIRWLDLKRLSVIGEGVNLSKSIDGQLYELPAISKSYILPIPELVVDLSGIEQN
ncbi:MAG: RagB/SusD family nutrient uptake outer membrane protein [Chryseobacterium sp.]|nr:MAG: RagB/SusD family nutrient uptake outer membrane protein [Chryseobacterium sp.]